MMYRILIIILFTGFLYSCTKEEGTGGNATIKGEVIIRFYNDDFSEIISESPAKEEDVYILYGDDFSVGDQVETNYEGYFEFKYLRPGDYTIYVYSDDSSNLEYSNMMEVIKEVKISDRNETVDIGELVRRESLNYDDGNSSISGRVFLINYLNSSQWPHLVVKDTSLAQEQEVYLIYGEHRFYDERIRTNYDGTFTFENLIKGKYKIFLYSEDVSGGTQDEVWDIDKEITEEKQNIVLNDIYIYQL